MQVPYPFLDRLFVDPEPYIDEMRDIIARGDFTLGPVVERFERQFADYAGVKHGIGVASGTDALMLALQAVGVGPGAEVITVSATFIATVGAVASVGATPVFVDVDDGIVMDVSQVEAKITPRTKAILPVHWVGNMADMVALSQIARRHNLALIEDACHAIGAELDGQKAGTLSDAACFSFHPMKQVNAWGDGGMVITNSDEIDAKLRVARNYGLINRDEAETFARNSRLHTLQIPILRRQLDNIEALIAKRIEIATRYDRALSELDGKVWFPRRRSEVRHAHLVYPIMTENRDDLIAHLKGRGVGAPIHYPLPMHLTRAGRKLGYKEGDLPVSEAYANKTLTLPAHQFLTDEEIEYTIDSVRSFFA